MREGGPLPYEEKATFSVFVFFSVSVIFFPVGEAFRLPFGFIRSMFMLLATVENAQTKAPLCKGSSAVGGEGLFVI